METQAADSKESTEKELEMKDLPFFPQWQQPAEKKDSEPEMEMDPTASGSAGPPEKGSDLLKEIERLKEEQKKQRADRARLAKDLKNAEKRRTRLKTKAKMLSENDLQEVLGMRAREAALKKMAAESATSEASPQSQSPAKSKAKTQ